MLTMNDRMLKLATADQKTLSRVDQVLTGEDTTTAAFVDIDCRTVTYTDAARRLGCSRPTIYKFVKNGRLDALAFDGVNRITVKSINEFAAGERPPDAATVERMSANAERNRAKARIRRAKSTTKITQPTIEG